MQQVDDAISREEERKKKEALKKEMKKINDDMRLLLVHEALLHSVLICEIKRLNCLKGINNVKLVFTPCSLI